MKIKKDYKILSLLDLPYLGTPKDHIIEIFKILEQKFGLRKNSKQKLVDLGSGDGRIVIYAGLNYAITSIGYEISQDLIKEAIKQKKIQKREKIYKKKYFRKIKIRTADLFIQNLKNYDFIYIYSFPTMQKFLVHVFKTAKSEALFISYKYPLDQFESYLRLEYKIRHQTDNQDSYSYFYRMR